MSSSSNSSLLIKMIGVFLIILITFGSYMKDHVSIEKATRNVELFDTGIAIIAGLMIIPAVFAFSIATATHPRTRISTGSFPA